MDTCGTHLLFDACVNDQTWSSFRYDSKQSIRWSTYLQYFLHRLLSSSIILSQLDFDLSLTSASCCGIIPVRQRCPHRTLSFYLVKKKKKWPLYSACKNVLIFSISCLVWSGEEQRHQFHWEVLAGYFCSNHPGLEENSRYCIVMMWPHFAFLSILSFQASGKQVCAEWYQMQKNKNISEGFLATLKFLTLVKRVKIIKTRVLATWKVWEEKKKTCMAWDKMVKLPWT